MESHYGNGNCTYDFLSIKEASSLHTDAITDLGTYCGMNNPNFIHSTKDRVLIQFQSDESVADNGFRLEWVLNGCGGKLKKLSGSFSSPNWPNGYQNNIACKWDIEAPLGSKIELNITGFELEDSFRLKYIH